jgi:hypothetical protein
LKYVQPYGVSDPNAPYINGDPSIGQAGSIPPAAAFEHPMREIVHMEEKCGLAPLDTDLYQLLKAIRTQKVNWAIDTGTTNHLVCTFDPVLQAYNNGFVVRIQVGHTNTAPSEIDCGPGFRNIVRMDGSPLAAGDMPAGGIAKLCYVDNEFQLLNPNIASAIQQAMGFITGGAGPTGGGGGTTYVTNVYNGFVGMIGYENAGTYDWTVPPGVQRAWCQLWAGGGPGCEWNQQFGMFVRGGDGGYAEGLVTLVPGTIMRIVVGAGAKPPVSPTTGNVNYNGTNWKNTYGGQSTFGPAGGPAVFTCTGGRGCYPNPPGDTDPSPGEHGHGVGGVINRANGSYGRGGGDGQASDGVYDDYIEDSGDPGAFVAIY